MMIKVYLNIVKERLAGWYMTAHELDYKHAPFSLRPKASSRQFN